MMNDSIVERGVPVRPLIAQGNGAAADPLPRAGRQLSGTRGLFTALAFAAVIPVLLFGGWMAYLTADQERRAARDAAAEGVRQVARRVEVEIAHEVEVAETLASSTSLDSLNLQGFYEEAARIVTARPLWETVALAKPDGQQVLNVQRPLGAELGKLGDPESFADAIRTREPVIGGIGPFRSLSGKRLVPLRVPVLRSDEVRYVLTIGLIPDQITFILREAGLPPGWLGAVVDANGSIIARTQTASSQVGEPASASVQQAIASAESGSYRGYTLEGVEVETVYRTLAGTRGWSVHLGIPSSELNAPVYQSLGLLFGGAATSVALAIGLGLMIARDVAQRREDEALRSALALDSSEKRGALAVEAAELGTWRCDWQTGEFTGSGRFRDLVGLPHAAGEPRWTGDRIFAAVHPDDRGALRRFGAVCIESGRSCEVEFRIGGADGDRWLRAAGRAEVRDNGGRDAIIYGVVADINLQKRAETLRIQLLRRLAAAQEAEQRRISRELHDQVGQTVTGLSLGLKALERSLTERTHTADIEQVRWLQNLANEIGREIHRAASDLRPTALDDLGLFRALRSYLSEWKERYGIAVDLHTVGEDARIPLDVQTVLYRVIQEALTNVLKHAQASNVSIVLEERSNVLVVVIEDDGKGFGPEALGGHAAERGSGLGISGMRERLSLVGGSMTLEAAPQGGASIFVQVPMREEAS